VIAGENETESGAGASHVKRVIPWSIFLTIEGRIKQQGRRTMVRKNACTLAVFVMLLVVLPLAAQAPSQADLYGIYQIKDEGFNHSQVMDIMGYLSDVYGPRLTNSPDIKEAAAWTTGKMKEWQARKRPSRTLGTVRPRLVQRTLFRAGDFPAAVPLIAYSKAWTPGTNGPVSAPAVLAPILKEEDIQKYRGQLKEVCADCCRPRESRALRAAGSPLYGCRVSGSRVAAGPCRAEP